ncbi:MAG: S-layer homology domain-containing protein, partial [Firmicutes bacterium]|nr:S-layer homology domain-containing protein [Bacillota bacterium]
GKIDGLLADVPLTLGTAEQTVTISNKETDKTALNEAIEAAEADKDETAVSKDGGDVPEGEDWVTEEAAKALEEAVAKAKEVAENPNADQDEIDKATEAVKKAKEDFDAAKKQGEYCPSRKFTDVDISKWYHGALDYVLIKNYFNGTSDTTFEPESPMTRAMFVTVLSRMEGIDAGSYTGSDFSDVETGKWFSAPIQWASQNGIVLGIGEGKFNPDGKVTREQMAAIMYRYANYKKIDTSGVDAEKYNAFKDKDDVSGYAVEAVKWAVSAGIINGMGDNTIAPKKDSTRAQVAQIVKNYDEKVAS